jgi:hypothetical protein
MVIIQLLGIIRALLWLFIENGDKVTIPLEPAKPSHQLA